MARKDQNPDVIPLFGRDEMNMVEFPFGPITAGEAKTFEVEHPVYDRHLKREVKRKLLITGSEGFGLPKPIDDQVLIGMKALTYENRFATKKVEFSRYRLCRTIGWPADGRAYRRLEESLIRIAGTTLIFKDSWWDKGELEWMSMTFHLIENVKICSRDRFDRGRMKNKQASHQLCSFVWNDVIWKSFQDGFIKSIDMKMFRKISGGRRREVPLRLYRVLDKRLYNSHVARFDLRKLCIGTLGLSQSYCPSEMIRVLERAASWLIECGFICEMEIKPHEKTGVLQALFYKKGIQKRSIPEATKHDAGNSGSRILAQFEGMPIEKQNRLLAQAITFCETSHQELVDGYRRNKNASGEAAKGYLEMILKTFVTESKKTKAA